MKKAIIIISVLIVLGAAGAAVFYFKGGFFSSDKKADSLSGLAAPEIDIPLGNELSALDMETEDFDLAENVPDDIFPEMKIDVDLMK